MSKKLYTETFFIDPGEGLNEGVLKVADLVVTELPVAEGSYPPEKYTAVTGKKYGALWSDNPWSDRLGDEPIGSLYDLQRFLDKYFFLTVVVVYLRGELSYNEDGSIEKSGGNNVYKTRLVKIYTASTYAENKPTTFMFKVFEDDGTTPIIGATATVKFGNIEEVIEYDEDTALYTGEVYGLGPATLTIEAAGFDDYVLSVTLSPSGVIETYELRQTHGYTDSYLSIVMVATTP